MVAVLDGSGNEAGEDLQAVNGDFTMLESTYQHQRQLLMDALKANSKKTLLYAWERHNMKMMMTGELN